MKSLLYLGFLVYSVFKTIECGRNYFAEISVQNNGKRDKKTKKFRNDFIFYILWSIVLFFALLGADI